MPDENLFLDPKSPWVGFRVTDDNRTAPQSLFAGRVDELELRRGGRCLRRDHSGRDRRRQRPTRPRADYGKPPDYAPDRRHLISLADGFKDRVDRNDVLDPAYVADLDATSREILDLMERVYETMGLTNVDVYNNRVNNQENPAIAFDKGIPFKATEHFAFLPPPTTVGKDFPLTERGRQFHRRFTSIELFRDMLREHPDLISEWIRPPFSADPFFTRQMPPVMRDSSGGPLHLTRRQYDILTAWAQKIRQDVEEGS